MTTASPCSPLREQRAERRLMRIRGAGTREVTTDFGFAFALSASPASKQAGDERSNQDKAQAGPHKNVRTRSRLSVTAEATQPKVLKVKPKEEAKVDARSHNNCLPNANQHGESERPRREPVLRAKGGDPCDREPIPASELKQISSQSRDKNGTRSTSSSSLLEPAKRKIHAEEFRYRKKSDQTYRSPSSATHKKPKLSEDGMSNAPAVPTTRTDSGKSTTIHEQSHVINDKLSTNIKEVSQPLHDSKKIKHSRQKPVSNEDNPHATTEPLSSISASRTALGELDANHSPARKVRPEKRSRKVTSAQVHAAMKTSKADHHTSKQEPVERDASTESNKKTGSRKRLDVRETDARRPASRTVKLERQRNDMDGLTERTERGAVDRMKITKSESANVKDVTSRGAQPEHKLAPQPAARINAVPLKSRYRTLPTDVDEMDLDDLLNNIATLAKDKKCATSKESTLVPTTRKRC